MFINSTLCYIEKDGKYLMLYRNKKENDPCEGKWVGVGGKFEAGEDAEACVLREVFEETGLKLTSYQARGVVHFHSNELPDEDMYLYTADGFEGADPVSSYDCNEGELRWVKKEDVLALNLWEGDKYFIEKLIAGEMNIEITCAYEGNRIKSLSI